MATLHVRRLDANGDDTFGRGMQSFLFASSATLQRLGCALKVIAGEWFLDVTDGVPWFAYEGSGVEPILGKLPGDLAYAESVLKARILATDGVATIKSFDISVDRNTRAVTVYVTGTDDDGADFSVTVSP